MNIELYVKNETEYWSHMNHTEARCLNCGCGEELTHGKDLCPPCAYEEGWRLLPYLKGEKEMKGCWPDCYRRVRRLYQIRSMEKYLTEINMYDRLQLQCATCTCILVVDKCNLPEGLDWGVDQDEALLNYDAENRVWVGTVTYLLCHNRDCAE